MRELVVSLRRHAARIVASVLILTLYGFAKLPSITGEEQTDLALRFSFDRLQLLQKYMPSERFVRNVHPELQRIAGWISAVGAGVALADFDGDGLVNEICQVEPRTDRVLIQAIPGTPVAYDYFELDASPLPYDEATMAPMGCLAGDFNEDGLTDILVYYWGRTPILFLRRGETNTRVPAVLSNSSFVARELIPSQERWYTNCATQADLDGDGHVDLILGNYFPDDARVLDSAGGGGGEQMQQSMSRALNGGRNRLLLWNGARSGSEPSATFKEADDAITDEVAKGWTLAVGAADLDGDLLPEIYFANDFGPDRLLHNRSTPGHLKFAMLEGKKGLLTPSSKVLGRDSFKGMGVDFADINGDGYPDIYVSNIAQEYALEESNFVWVSTGEVELMKTGIAPYVDRSEALGLSRSAWAWDARLADFDNDGVPEAIQATGFVKGNVNRWPELHELAMANDQLLENPRIWPRFQNGDDLSGDVHMPFFVRASNGRYYDLAKEIGIDQEQISRGIAVGDVNGDGKLDFVVANQWTASYVYLNQSLDVGESLILRLLLPIRTRPSSEPKFFPENSERYTQGVPAIGAEAAVILPDGRRFVAQVDGGSGHSGKRSQELHFGLGDISPDTELNVEVRWRGLGGVHQTVLKLQPGWHPIYLAE